MDGLLVDHFAEDVLGFIDLLFKLINSIHLQKANIVHVLQPTHGLSEMLVILLFHFVEIRIPFCGRINFLNDLKVWIGLIITFKLRIVKFASFYNCVIVLIFVPFGMFFLHLIFQLAKSRVFELRLLTHNSSTKVLDLIIYERWVRGNQNIRLAKNLYILSYFSFHRVHTFWWNLRLKELFFGLFWVNRICFLSFLGWRNGSHVWILLGVVIHFFHFFYRDTVVFGVPWIRHVNFTVANLSRHLVSPCLRSIKRTLSAGFRRNNKHAIFLCPWMSNIWGFWLVRTRKMLLLERWVFGMSSKHILSKAFRIALDNLRLIQIPGWTVHDGMLWAFILFSQLVVPNLLRNIMIEVTGSYPQSFSFDPSLVVNFPLVHDAWSFLLYLECWPKVLSALKDRPFHQSDLIACRSLVFIYIKFDSCGFIVDPTIRRLRRKL